MREYYSTQSDIGSAGVLLLRCENLMDEVEDESLGTNYKDLQGKGPGNDISPPRKNVWPYDEIASTGVQTASTGGNFSI